ncbi:host attachment protein (plasmid) [Rhizobium johnstonii]|nr:host attachment protein [Rhizobium johnstonii]
MIVPNDVTIAVIDGRSLRLFRNVGHEPHVDLAALPEPALEPAHAGSGIRHRSSAANPDDQRLREDDFAAAVAGYLNKQVLGSQIRKLIVIADPRSLGELRRHFHAALTERLLAEIAKDLAGQSTSEIEAAIVLA